MNARLLTGNGKNAVEPLFDLVSRSLTIVALFLTALSTRAEPPSIDALVSLMEGTFVAADQSFTYRRSRISAPALGRHVVYLQVNRGEEHELYRQRILLLSEDPAGNAVTETAWTLAEPEAFEDAEAHDPVFGALTFDDLAAAMADGCEQRWRRSGDGWTGTVDPARCRIISKRTGLPRRIQSESRLSQAGIQLAERGFDDSGEEQLFGTPPGEWLELRRGSNSGSR